MKDRVYMALAALGFVLICIIFVKNYDVKQDAKTFEIGTYYTPDISNQQKSAYEIYQQIAGSRAIQCPETGLSGYNGMIANIGVMFSNNTHNRYDVSYWIFPMSISNEDGGFISLDSGSDIYYKNVMHLGSSYTVAGTVAAKDLYSGINLPDEPWPIISPFAFSFLNSNTDNVDYVETEEVEVSSSGETIIIINSKRNCRITFDNVSNWFCAGPVGTSMTLGSKTNNDEIEWENHRGHHQTIIGSSGNADVNGGGAGQVIGYANKNTTVAIEVLVGTDWVPISADDFIKTPL